VRHDWGTVVRYIADMLGFEPATIAPFRDDLPRHVQARGDRVVTQTFGRIEHDSARTPNRAGAAHKGDTHDAIKSGRGFRVSVRRERQRSSATTSSATRTAGTPYRART
jgi:hypothetical protein